MSRSKALPLLALTVSSCGMPQPPIGFPSSKVGSSEGAVVDLSRIITELKCDVREWVELDRNGKSSRMIVGDVGVELGLTYNRSGDGATGIEAGVPISPVTLKFSGEQSTEAKSESSVTLPFMLYQKPLPGVTPPKEDINCTDYSTRLPERILPLSALASQISKAPAAAPYFGWAGNIQIKGKFYFQKVGKTGFSVVTAPISFNVAKGTRGGEYVQTYDAYVALGY